MSDPYIGEIRLFAGNFAPAGWALCQGQLMPIAENDALFTLIGTTYGGDGQQTFALPDLQGRVPLHQGTLAGNTYVIGERSGTESVTLTTTQLPIHNHRVGSTGQPGTTGTPSSSTIVADEGPANIASVFAYQPFDGTNQVQISAASVSQVGGNQPHDNMQPYLTLNYIISLFGIFPSQS
ncbi:microcystin dependent MdpB family protein [Mesorhizobium sp. L-8-10]|uniref:phage tail protein n=1 Tax=unclassified Mesorhizobium TaxID=325217 RepID=UPI001926F263|nr:MULTISPECIES: tail fiber protein [unclassified Mesorhizobium]BCH25349.1 microcystin dependent MdpB family protein [Mesorhizobium sp. L-8-3]BCH33358.1 microcystin dependent MdpB family protein [Mesorhizobium sp. L-8-10]